MRALFEVVTPGEPIATVPAEPLEEGGAWLWRVVCGQLRNDDGGMSDHLGKARIICGNGRQLDPTNELERLAGDQTAYAELAEPPAIDGPIVRFRAAFDGDTANFTWREVGLTSVQGVMVIRGTMPPAPKAPGTAREVTCTLELSPQAVSPRRRRLLLVSV